MIDFFLCFPTFEIATQVSVALGFTTVDNIDDPEIIETIEATHDLAIKVIGEHYVLTGETDSEGNALYQPDGKWWIMVRVLTEIPIPPQIEPFIAWRSDSVDENNEPIPQPVDGSIPMIRWA